MDPLNCAPWSAFSTPVGMLEETLNPVSLCGLTLPNLEAGERKGTFAEQARTYGVMHCKTRLVVFP